MIHKRSHFARMFSLFGLGLMLLLGVFGCGSGSHTRGKAGSTGRAVITLRWPEPADTTRLVPVAAKSVRVLLKEGTTTVAERLLVRPVAPPWVTTTTIENVPFITLSASATAHPNADGTGTAQATVTMPVTVQVTGDTNLRLTMASTIDRIEVTPNPARVEEARTVPLQARAVNAAGETVLLISGTIQFISSLPTIATVASNGIVTGKKVGEATISVTEPESGKTLNVPISVVPSTVSYRLLWLDSLPTARLTEAVGLNEKGEVIGYSFVDTEAQSGSEWHGWVWKPNADFTGGTVTDLGDRLFRNGQEVATAHYVIPTSINDTGQICGTYKMYTPTFETDLEPFHWENGTLTPLSAVQLEVQDFIATGIDNAGRVYGYRYKQGGFNNYLPLIWHTLNDEPTVVTAPVPDQRFNAVSPNGIAVSDRGGPGNFLYQGGQWTQIPRTTPAYENGGGPDLLGVNSRGHATGWLYWFSNNGNIGVAHVWRDNYLFSIGTLPGHSESIGRAIADDDTVVGNSYKPFQADIRAFRWRFGKMEDLNTLISGDALEPEWNGRGLYKAADVNNKGFICGTGVRGAYLLIPRPNSGNVNVGVR